MRYVLSLVIAMVLLMGCAPSRTMLPARTSEKPAKIEPDCGERNGRCFDARVGGHWAIVLADIGEFEGLIKLLEARRERVQDLFWIVEEPLTQTSALDVIVRANDMGRSFLGELADGEPDVTIHSLDDQLLDVISEVKPSPNVFVNGMPMLVQQDTLAQNYLPPGRYALMIDYHGLDNWDRKWVFIKVR